MDSVTLQGISSAAADAGKAPDNAITTTNGGVVIDPSKPASSDKGAAGDRPAWLPEKFATPEDMAKAYGELETKLGSAKKPDAAAPAADTTAVEAAATKAGVDLNAIGKEYAENGGKLTDATMKSLADKGISKEAVDAYIGGLTSKVAKLQGELATIAGGEEQLKSVYEWAKTNLSADEIKAYNSALSTNPDAAKMVLAGVVSRYTAATGSEPKLIDAAPSPSSGEKPFESSAEVTRAMGDPKYKTDQAFRDKVARRLAISPKVFA